MKRNKLKKRLKGVLVFTDRQPTVEECEKCKYQNDCDCGRFCTRTKQIKRKKQ